MQDNIEMVRELVGGNMLAATPTAQCFAALAAECEQLRRGIDALTERLEGLEPGVRLRDAAPFSGVRGVTPQVGPNT